ncbi:MAG: YeeE/YedE family protein [bacterium]|nr:YeeE/YedE family protein [bacterium]
MELLLAPWPWYVSGPLIGLTVPLLLILGGRVFGMSSSLRHICAAVYPAKVEYLNYDWRREGLWLILMVAGLVIGGWIGGNLLRADNSVDLAGATVNELAALGISDIQGLAPPSLFSWSALRTWPSILLLVVGGFLIGFGTRWANGCTSGHGITGLANLQWPSLLAVIGFFIGGLLATHLLFPLIF